MSLVGSLEDLGLGDILQIVSLSRKSGVLNLNWGEVRGKIMFRDGQVVAALTNQIKLNLGQQLAERGAISAETGESILAQAQRSKTDLREAFVKQARVNQTVINQIVKQQIEDTVFSFFAWPEGNFNFELMEIETEIRNLSLQHQAFLLEVGLSPQYLAMEGTRLQDEHRRETAGSPVGPPRTRAPEPSPAPAQATSPSSSPEEDDFSSVADFVAAVESRKKETPPSPPPSEAGVPSPAPRQNLSAAPAPESDAGIGTGLKPAPLSEVAVPAPQPAPAEPEIPVPSPLPTVAVLPGAAPTLLVVDDDPLMGESVAHYLEPKGFQVQCFSRVSEVMDRIGSFPSGGAVPVVVADLLMPGWDESQYLGGLDLVERIRKERPEIPCVLMTDYENQAAQQRAKDLGANYFFFKPKSSQLEEDFSSPELINFVAVLENAISTFSAPRPAAPVPAARIREEMVNLGEELRREMGEDDFTAAAGATAEVFPSRGLSMLKAMISELNDPSSSGQITLLVLRFASEMMNRAVIFLVARNQIAGLGQFGIDLNGADPEKQVRRMRIPLSEPSIFQESVQKRMVLKKKLRRSKWNQYLVEQLGGVEPTEVFVAPILAGGRIAAILYGDNVPELREIGDTESLEIFLAQAGQAMEKALLERRIQEMRESERAGA